jgi:hypothetical protein
MGRLTGLEGDAQFGRVTTFENARIAIVQWANRRLNREYFKDVLTRLEFDWNKCLFFGKNERD